MMLSMLILGTFLLLISRYRVWLAFAAGGMIFAAAIWAMMRLVALILPDELSVLAGVLSFMIVTGFIFLMVEASEKQAAR